MRRTTACHGDRIVLRELNGHVPHLDRHAVVRLMKRLRTLVGWNSFHRGDFRFEGISMPLHVLIIEDDALIAHDLEAIVEDAGYSVVGIVRTMHDALALAGRTAINVALVDIVLAAGTDGVETARRLREEHGVRSLFVTAKVERRAEAMDLAWHPIGFVAKPYAAVEIVRALERVDQSSPADPRKA